MNSKIICTWLGFTDWPPDHHTLLGLKQGEGDAACIERQVQERMAKLRCYQLSHPDEATEGMNRVAQAFICLTEELSKPRPVNKESGLAPAVDPPTMAGVDTTQIKTARKHTEVDWKNAPPPVRVSQGSQKPAVAAVSEKPAHPVVSETAALKIDPIFALAHESPEARRGLSTLPALFERIHLTRRLIHAWNQAGKYLSNTRKKLTKATEETDLTRRLNKIFELTADFPKIVGHPGQPGYRVVAMARLEMTAQMFKMLDPDQREALARDWESGYRMLLAHRRFLRSQFKGLRRRGYLHLAMQALRGAINDYSVWVWTGVLLIIGLCVFWFWKIMKS